MSHIQPTTSATEADQLRQQVLDAEAALKAAQTAQWQAMRAAERAGEQAQAPARDALAALLHRFQDRALELAIEAGECPYERWGSHMDPSDARVSDEGVVLSWDINGDYAPQYFVAGWDALLTPTSVQGESA